MPNKQSSSFWLGAEGEPPASQRDIGNMTLDEAEAYRKGYADGMQAAQLKGCEVSRKQSSKKNDV